MIVQVDVEQIDVPWYLGVVHNIGLDNIPDVPDPYLGGRSDFELVQEIALRTCKPLLDWIRAREDW